MQSEKRKSDPHQKDGGKVMDKNGKDEVNGEKLFSAEGAKNLS